MRFSKLFAFALLAAWPALVWSQDTEQKAKKVIRLHKADATEKSEATRVHVDDQEGKIVIIEKDGKKREIDLKGASSFTINKSSETTEQDGEVKKKFSGKAIIVGPDGERQEIELTGPDFNFETGEPGKFKLFRVEAGPDGVGHMSFLPAQIGASGKYFVGVHCEPVDAALRSHLKIDEDAGLMIHKVTEDSPAAKAELKANDILMYANDQKLSSLEQLIEIVEQSGKDDAAITFSIIRGGEEKKIEVKPAERQEMPGALEFKAGEEMKGLHEHLMELDVDVNADKLLRLKPKFGPGIIRAEGLDQEHFDKMRAELDAARAEMEKAHVQMREEMARAHKEMVQQMQEAQKQMQEAMKAQQKAFKELKSKSDKDDNNNDDK